MESRTQQIAVKHITAPLREVAKEINDYLPLGQGYSHQAIYTWLTGTRRPRYFTMLYLSENSTGWVRDFATEMLAAIKEDRHAG